MVSTGLMAIVLVISYGLMFGLVKFAENIIAIHENQSAADNNTGSAARLQHHDGRRPAPAGQ